jgi:hypothetical protein
VKASAGAAYRVAVLLLIGVLAAGVLLGLAFGGSLGKLAELSFRWWWLALLGLAVQFVPVHAHALAVGLLILSYALLTVFVLANIRMPGMPLIAIGFVLNMVAVAANGGMPVSDHALHVAYGKDYLAQVRELTAGRGGAKHHLQRPDDVLVILTDVIPIGAPVHVIASAGDLLSLIGAGWLLFGATLGRTGSPSGPGDRPGKHREGRTTLVRPNDGSPGSDAEDAFADRRRADQAEAE